MPCSGWYGIGMGFEGGSRHTAGLSEEELGLLILSILEERGPAPGYEVALALEERSEGGIDPDPELVYPLLQLLVDQELVSVVDPDAEKKVYQLTDSGRERIERLRKRIEVFWNRARMAAWATDADAFDAAIGTACYSVHSAFREVGRALDEVMEGVFGGCCGVVHVHRRRGHGKHRSRCR